MSGHNEKAFHCRRKSWRCDLSGDVRGWDAVCDGEAAGGLVTRKEELPDGIHIEALRSQFLIFAIRNLLIAVQRRRRVESMAPVLAPSCSQGDDTNTPV